MEKNSKIYIAGHTGMVGAAIVRNLKEKGYNNLVLKTSKQLDLTRQEDVENFFKKEKPQYVFLAAAKVGGIMANNMYPAEFMYENMMISMNVINASYKNNVKKLMFLGSSCIYPKYANQPIEEEALLKGELEPTNEAYAIAKISGMKYCKYLNKEHKTNYISVMPTNLYGINDSYDRTNSHVLPALILKIHEAKKNNKSEVVLWGDGTPLREFLYVDDLADILVYLMNNYNDNQFLNIGSGKEISIKQLAELIKKVVGYNGKIKFDKEKPNGTPRKLLNTEKLKQAGWNGELIDLEKGIKKTYEDFLKRNICN